MNWLADENIDQQVVEALRNLGHSVWSVAEQKPGLTDEVILAQARAQSAILITSDKDFGELVYRQKRVTHGVLLLRLHGISPVQRAKLVVDAVVHFSTEFVNAFSVLDASGLRIRRSP